MLLIMKMIRVNLLNCMKILKKDWMKLKMKMICLKKTMMNLILIKNLL